MDEELLTERFFTEALEGDQYLWTSGFLNERFTDPLSPLGWSVIREPFETLAVRDPLRFLGYPQAETLPLTKLYRGLPFVNGLAFQIMYRLFPDSLLPEDAWRYFPSGDVSLRQQASYPPSLWHPRVLFALARALIRDPGDWLPTHQYRRWESFVPRFEATMAKAKQAIATGLAFSETPHWVARVVAANRQLLQLHRWSLTYADLCYSLLRRLLRRWIGEEAEHLAAELATDLGDKTMEMDRAIRWLVRSTDASDSIQRALATAHSFQDLERQLSADDVGRTLLAAVAKFLDAFGHRSYTLDLLQPPFADDPDQVLTLMQRLLAAKEREPKAPTWTEALREVRSVLRPPGRFLAWRWWVISNLTVLMRQYMRLREDQRFYWQKGLAILRHLFLIAGQAMVERGAFRETEEVFFLTREEIKAYGEGRAAGDVLAQIAQGRRAVFQRLRQAAEPYPDFLVGNTPLTEPEEPDPILRGIPVSPGVARGPARIVARPDHLAELQPGDILIVRTADPGWTPVFGEIGGLVMEHGGQLSHAAVVAREYGLPAIAGLHQATQRLQEGELILIDGDRGTVHRIGTAQDV